MSASQWICSQCTFINVDVMSKCEMCYLSKTESKTELKTERKTELKTELKNTQWSCTRCTYKNKDTTLICKICTQGSRGDSCEFCLLCMKTHTCDQVLCLSLGEATQVGTRPNHPDYQTFLDVCATLSELAVELPMFVQPEMTTSKTHGLVKNFTLTSAKDTLVLLRQTFPEVTDETDHPTTFIEAVLKKKRCVPVGMPTRRPAPSVGMPTRR